jgi:hypothetical protein
VGDPLGRHGDAPIPAARRVRCWSMQLNHAFDRHPLLADALEDAVYIDAGILAHCRKLGEHVMRM